MLTLLKSDRRQRLQTIALLRLSTGAQHRRLDQSSLLSLLVKKRIDITRYIRMLHCLYQAYRLVEPRLLSCEHRLQTPPIVPYRPRIPSIIAELRYMNRQVHEQRAAVLKSEHELDYWGMRYVLDGSCHGARHILPGLENNQGLCGQTTLEFWRLLAASMDHWPIVVRQINALAINRNDEMRMVEAARRTFQVFIDVFERAELNHEAGNDR